MNIEHCLILSAGFGTRMGPIGKILPKPAWPLFEVTLLDAQIAFAETLGCSRIHVNAHHLGQEMIAGLSEKNRQKIEVLSEPEILGSGGTIHHLKKTKSLTSELLLVLNADVFFLPSGAADFLSVFGAISENERAVLLGVKVPPQSTYNRLVLKSGNLIDIIPPQKNDKNNLTYSGLGLVNLKGLEKSKEKGGFFDLIANYKKETVRVVRPPDSFEYRDFGGLTPYVRNIYSLLHGAAKNEDGSFLNFLREKKFFLPELAGQDSYRSKRPGIVNFTGDNSLHLSDGVDKALLLGGGKDLRVTRNGVYHGKNFCPF